MSMSQSESYLAELVEQQEHMLAEKSRQLEAKQATIDLLERVIHKAARIAGHIPFLCREMPEVSMELDNAAQQLQQILVHRQA